MFKCAPYIKNICNSINTTWWREGTSSLPASPVHQSWRIPSPTRSEGGTELEQPVKDDLELTGLSMPSLVATTMVDKDGVASTQVTMSLVSPSAASDTPSGSTLSTCSPSVITAPPPPGSVGTIVPVILNKESSSPLHHHSMCPNNRQADLLQNIRKVRPDSPDVTRAAKRFERAKNLGAIPKETKSESPTHR